MFKVRSQEYNFYSKAVYNTMQHDIEFMEVTIKIENIFLQHCLPRPEQAAPHRTPAHQNAVKR